jgi:hypothetical protein
MIGASIVVAMETSLLSVQATRVMVMPLLALVESGKTARADSLSCHELRAIIRELPKCACDPMYGEDAPPYPANLESTKKVHI